MKLINNTCPECDTEFTEEQLKDEDGVIFEGDESIITCPFCGSTIIVTVESVTATLSTKLDKVEEEPDGDTA